MVNKFRGGIMDCQKMQAKSFENISVQQLAEEITQWVRSGKSIQVEHTSMCHDGNKFVALVFYRIYVP